MSKTILAGKRLIPLEHIALVEPFDPAAYPDMQTDRPFRSRIVLIDRESVLTEEPIVIFAEANGFRTLPEEGVATNPLIRFGVEVFHAADGFNPTKPYQSRLTWRDLDGNTQSKLLLTAPQAVLAIVVRGETEVASQEPSQSEPAPPGSNGSKRRRSRRRAEEPAPS